MLDSLHIQNYRLFKDLKIEKLGQVNLISGKNNCGKTALLEALRIAESQFDIFVINDIIRLRSSWEDVDINNPKFEDTIVQNYNTLLPYGERFEFNKMNIQDRFTKMSIGYFDVKGFVKNIDGDIFLGILNRNGVVPYPKKVINFCKETDDTLRFVPFNTAYSNLKLFDRFALTEDEDLIVEALQMIDKRIKRFTLDQNQQGKVKIDGYPNPVFLKTLGDGINRVLNIIFAFLLSKNKAIFIDEFEVGLHHSVQTQLWEIIFKYAKEWNIQVFVTTHSADTIRSFSYVLDKYPDLGQYMRLQKSRMTGEIEALIYTKSSLDTAMEEHFETR